MDWTYYTGCESCEGGGRVVGNKDDKRWAWASTDILTRRSFTSTFWGRLTVLSKLLRPLAFHDQNRRPHVPYHKWTVAWDYNTEVASKGQFHKIFLKTERICFKIPENASHFLNNYCQTWYTCCHVLVRLLLYSRYLQRDVVYLGWPIAPSYTWAQMRGRGELRGLSQWVQLYRGAQITPYLTYA